MVEDSEQDIVCMALQCLDAALAQVVPDLQSLVVTGSHKIRLVSTRVEVNIVDTLIVGLHGEVRCW